MASKLTIQVNGLRQNVRATPDTPLLYVLRNDLKLGGPMFGCGLSQCGACAVIAGGKEIRACVTPVAAVQGTQIHTLEGLPARWANQKGLKPSTELLHPVQQAWIDEQVPQCSYCQSGMMVTATVLLERFGARMPTNQQIRQGMNGHLCRCGTQLRIMAAIKRASKAMRA
jgi:isoquinoline 1-oxidoreductase alpha subunit